ncbi:hypothetical protein [Sporofaciens sp. JLR.KK001]|uniref:hypothetical protein n=1 Tax=Sporofaciens sp. JLR.KK001 TaxID=3112621 RepID=UPI002FEFF350
MKGYLDVKELESYKKADIQKLARDLGVSDAGTIKEIAARCAAVEIETGAGEPPTEPGKAAGEQAEERTGQQTGDGAGDTTGAPQTGQETAEKDKAAEITSDTEKAQEEAGKAAGGVRVEVVARYLDQQFNQIKEAGEVFTVDRERAAVLVHEKVVKIRE